MGLTASFGAFLLLRFLAGVASALALILASALVLDRLAEAGRPGLMALHFAGVGGGIAVSAALVAMLLAAGGTWSAMWWEAVRSRWSGWPPSRCWYRANRRRHRSPDPQRRRARSAPGPDDRGLWPVRLRLRHNRDIPGGDRPRDPAIRPLEPIIWIIVGLAAAPSVAFWSWLARRIGIQAAFATAALAEAIGVLASVVWPSEVGICVAAVLVGGTFMGLTALGLVRGRELAQANPALGDPRRVMAAMTGAFGVGQIVGPSLAGVLSDALGGFAVPSVAAAAALVLAAWLARR